LIWTAMKMVPAIAAATPAARVRLAVVAAGLRDRGVVDLDHGGQPAQLGFAAAGRLGQWSGRRGSGVGDRPQGGLGGCEPHLDPIEVAVGQSGPGVSGCEESTALDDISGQGLNPLAQHPVVTAPTEVG
jgi:hypothetical protein